MRTRTRTDTEWHGDEIKRRAERANARGTIAIGEGVVSAAKRVVHVISGTLRRSIHAAAARTGGTIDATTQNVRTKDGAVVDAGSWIEYACVEETGRGHAYMQPAVEQVRATVHITMQQAYAEEGLR